MSTSRRIELRDIVRTPQRSLGRVVALLEQGNVSKDTRAVVETLTGDWRGPAWVLERVRMAEENEVLRNGIPTRG